VTGRAGVAPAPPKATGGPSKRPRPSAASASAGDPSAARPETAFRAVTWRRGTRGALRGEFAAAPPPRGSGVADGPVAARAQHLPGAAAWLVCERRSGGERKCHPTNQSSRRHAAGEVLAALIKARWVCERAHRRLKGELGLDPFGGRSRLGLHHHALLCPIAPCFLQHLRLRRRGGKSRGRRPGAAARAPSLPAAGAAAPRRGPPRRGPELLPAPLPPCRRPVPYPLRL
jgi:hypothetical protein